MGFRLSLYLMEKKEWERCLDSSTESYEELDPQTVEDVMYDWCTDAFMDMYRDHKVPRLTKQTLDWETDICVGILHKDAFQDLIKYIYARASKHPFPWEDAAELMCNLDHKYEFGYSTTWHSAFFTALHIYKTVDWNNYVLFAKVS